VIFDQGENMKMTKLLMAAAILVFAVSSMLPAQENGETTTPVVTPANDAKFTSWARVRGSYQMAWKSDMDLESGFDIDRARLGMDGMLLENLYFKVDIDAKNTKKGKGAELKVAFASWEFMKGHYLEVGAITTTFTRELSGTEFAFINYDITSGLDSYQYGVQVRGSLIDNMMRYYASVSGGEGLSKINTANGYLYMGRLLFTVLGADELNEKGKKTGKDEFYNNITEGNTSKNPFPTLAIGVAAALDNKATTYDQGYNYEYHSSKHLVADVTFKMGGISLFAQANYNEFDAKLDGSYWGGVNGNIRTSGGGFAQIGYNLGCMEGMPDIEPMFKYEAWNDVIDEGYGAEIREKRQFAIGVNWYFKGHGLKVNAEYRHVTTDENLYLTKAPSDNFFGVRITQSFSSGKIK